MTTATITIRRWRRIACTNLTRSIGPEGQRAERDSVTLGVQDGCSAQQLDPRPRALLDARYVPVDRFEPGRRRPDRVLLTAAASAGRERGAFRRVLELQDRGDQCICIPRG